MDAYDLYKLGPSNTFWYSDSVKVEKLASTWEGLISKFYARQMLIEGEKYAIKFVGHDGRGGFCVFTFEGVTPPAEPVPKYTFLQ